MDVCVRASVFKHTRKGLQRIVAANVFEWLRRKRKMAINMTKMLYTRGLADDFFQLLAFSFSKCIFQTKTTTIIIIEHQHKNVLLQRSGKIALARFDTAIP